MNKQTPEAKALSLFLMAHKKINSSYKEKAKRINKKWSLVLAGELSKSAYIGGTEHLGGIRWLFRSD